MTAHRGHSSRYPENTLWAFRMAMEVGADIVEFDVRETRDGELVILHDAALDRTTNGSGPVANQTWAQLQKLNATYWQGPHDTGRRLAKPAGSDGIPRLSEALELLSGQVGLNIQVYTESAEALNKLAALYMKYALSESAFLMLKTFQQAEWIRKHYPQIALCVGEQRDRIERHLAAGVDFMQPRKSHLTADYLRRIQAAGVPFNVFYANTEIAMHELLERNVQGIMTDDPERLLTLL